MHSASCHRTHVKRKLNIFFRQWRTSNPAPPWRCYCVDTVKQMSRIYHIHIQITYVLYNTIQYNTKFVKRHVAVASEADCGGVLAHFCCFSGNLLTYLLSYILVVEATIKENMNNTLVSMISLLQLLLLLIDVIMTSAQRTLFKWRHSESRGSLGTARWCVRWIRQTRPSCLLRYKSVRSSVHVMARVPPSTRRTRTLSATCTTTDRKLSHQSLTAKIIRLVLNGDSRSKSAIRLVKYSVSWTISASLVSGSNNNISQGNVITRSTCEDRALLSIC